MAESIGLVFAVASLVLQLGDLYKNKSADLRYLKQDLETFKEFLVLSEHILPLNHHLRTACEELVTDIEVLLCKQAGQRRWQKFTTLGSREIPSLRERLTFQMQALQGRHRFVDPYNDKATVSGYDY